jgi:hypothetical protein
MPALPQHALITIHNEGAVNIPKSHLHVELSKRYSANVMKFIKLTPKSKVIYELFMDGESFYDHENEIKEVIQALLQSNIVMILSFRHTFLDYVEQFLENIPHKEIQRPFHQIPGISGTT